MEHLFDTCTIFNELNDNSKLFEVVYYCRSIKEPFCISNEIEAELKRPLNMQSDHLAANIDSIWGYISNGNIKLISVGANAQTKANYEQIRERHYSWMARPEYCKSLIEEGVLSKEEYMSKGFRHKDAGECSLIAIALTNPSCYTIISEDKGRVYKHPEVNIFENYRNNGLTIVGYRDWQHYSNVKSTS